MTATIPAFFGKFSLAWPALLSLFGNKDIRRKLIWFKNKKQKRHRSTGTVSYSLKTFQNIILYFLYKSKNSQSLSQSISGNETEMTHKFNTLAV